jgi:SAM-dependent methyltransferase
VRQSSPSANRNRSAILDAWRGVLPASGLVLEVASGSGEHVTWFAQQLPGLSFQPSDPDPVARASIDAWREELGLSNVRPALSVDAGGDRWPFADASVDALININMIHISPSSATLGLLRHGARVLKSGAPLLTYGPYFQRDVMPAPSNVAFDESLRARDPAWGVRDLDDVVAAASDRAIDLEAIIGMPANNLCLVFRRRAADRADG